MARPGVGRHGPARRREVGSAAQVVDTVADVGAAHGRLWPRLHAAVEEIGVERVPPSIAVERGKGPLDFVAALPIPDGVRYRSHGAETLELPGWQRVASTVMYGDGFDAGFDALRTWIEGAGEREAGELREIYLDCDGPSDTWVVELQLALEPRG